MPRGVIKNVKGSYAFISNSEGDQDVFVHASTGALLQTGIWYEYEIVTNPKTGKTQAAQLRNLSPAEIDEERAWSGRNPAPVKFGEIGSDAE